MIASWLDNNRTRPITKTWHRLLCNRLNPLKIVLKILAKKGIFILNINYLYLIALNLLGVFFKIKNK